MANYFDQFDSAGGPAPNASMGVAAPPKQPSNYLPPFLNALQDQIARAMTWGLSDKASALGASIGHSDFADKYHEELARQRQAGQQFSQEHPIISPIATGIGTMASFSPKAVVPESLMGMIKQGAQLGALSGFGSANEESLSKDIGSTLLGSGIGGAVSGAAGLASRALAPQTSPAIQQFTEAGGKPTLGQIMGSPQTEETIAKFPGLTGAVNKAREGATDTFYRATINKALEPIGETLGDTTPNGTQAIAEATQKIGQVYDRFAKGSIGVDPITDFAAARSTLTPEAQKEFDRVVQQNVTDKLNNGALSGQAWKQARAKFADLADRYGAKEGGELLSDAFGTAQDILQGALQRANPMATELANANAAWGNLKVVNRAAGYSAAVKNSGVFNPEQFLLATRAKAGESLFNQGKGRMQDWAQQMYGALGSSAPVQAAGFHNIPISPFSLTSMVEYPFGLAARAAYTPANAIAGYLAQANRPTAPLMAKYLNQLAPAAALAASNRLPGLLEGPSR